MARLTAENYFSLLKSLLPKGPAWLVEADRTLYNLLFAFALEFAKFHSRVIDLQDEADPRYTVECVTDWERVLGLPDACEGVLPETLQQRQNAIVSKLTATGGQSREYFIDIARAHGFDIYITEFPPFRFGVSNFGSQFNGGSWSFTWQVNAQEFTPIYFEFGRSRFGERFLLLQNEGLECLMNRLKPAHTEVIFNYA